MIFRNVELDSKCQGLFLFRIGNEFVVRNEFQVLRPENFHFLNSLRYRPQRFIIEAIAMYNLRYNLYHIMLL